jgi:hypothetical protein
MNPGRQTVRSNKFLYGAPSCLWIFSIALRRDTLLAPNFGSGCEVLRNFEPLDMISTLVWI